VLAFLALLAAAGNGLIAFAQTGAPAGAVDVFDPATAAVHQLALGSAPAWSPDGSKLAYARDGQVYVANADGTGETAVGPGTAASWSPDGGAVALSRPDGLGIGQVYVVQLSDGSATQLTFGMTSAVLPTWSPDGKTIVFGSGSALYAVPAQGGDVRAIPLPTKVDGSASWSPDGTRLAFVADNGQVWIAGADGSGAHQVTYTLLGAGASPDRPSWSPDGGLVAWTQGADLCVTDPAGTVRRLTFTQSSQTSQASLPAWQPSMQPSSTLAAAGSGPSNTKSCDWNPGVRIEMFDSNVSSKAVALNASQQLVFVNHTANALTVTTTLQGERATVSPWGFAAFATQPGSYEFDVTGYPDGVPRSGTFDVAAAGSATIDEHAPIRYGASTVLSGAARGPAGSTVAIKARPAGSTRYVTVGTVKPAGGRWRLRVAPKITTRYQVSFAGDETDRLLRVKPNLRVTRSHTTIRISLQPAAPLGRAVVFLFRLGATGAWNEARTARIDRRGLTLLANVPSGRYYVGFQGNDRYWSTACEPFTVRR
jgi:hypothetical protein